MTTKAKLVTVAADEGDVKGKAMDGPQMVSALVSELSVVLSPMKRTPSGAQPFAVLLKGLGSPKRYTAVYAGEQLRGLQVCHVLDSLDFTVSKNPPMNVYSGKRLETNGLTTLVNYCSLSGVLVVSSTIKEISQHF